MHRKVNWNNIIPYNTIPFSYEMCFGCKRLLILSWFKKEVELSPCGCYPTTNNPYKKCIESPSRPYYYV